MLTLLTLLQEASRADAPRARNAPAHAVALTRLFAQPGVFAVPQSLRPQR